MKPPGVVLQEELLKVQKRSARFVKGNYKYELGLCLIFLESENVNLSRKGGEIVNMHLILRNEGDAVSIERKTCTVLQRC